MGIHPYEEYIPCNKELKDLSTNHGAVYDVYRELMWHFNICLIVNKTKGRNVWQKRWADYLFANLDSIHEEVKMRTTVDASVVARRMETSKHVDHILEEGQHPYHKGDLFKSFHH